MSMRHHHVASKLIQYHFYVMPTGLLVISLDQFLSFSREILKAVLMQVVLYCMTNYFGKVEITQKQIF